MEQQLGLSPQITYLKSNKLLNQVYEISSDQDYVAAESVLIFISQYLISDI